MTKELTKEIENYLIAGGYAEQLNDIWIMEDSNLDDLISFNDDSLLLLGLEEMEELQEIEPIEFEELY